MLRRTDQVTAAPLLTHSFVPMTGTGLRLRQDRALKSQRPTIPERLANR